MKFNEDMIRRRRLPADVRGLLHDLCWHMAKTPVENYVQRARAIMKSPKSLPSPKIGRILRRMFCDDCDGTGWTEGGKSLKTKCRRCRGSGFEPVEE